MSGVTSVSQQNEPGLQLALVAMIALYITHLAASLAWRQEVL
jgi:hypothetical protein